VQPVFNGVVLVGAILAAKLGLLKLRGRRSMPSSPRRTPAEPALASTTS
jgi:ribose transport system permease protein